MKPVASSIRQAILLLVLALLAGAAANAIRPDTLPWIEDWSAKRMAELGQGGSVDAKQAIPLLDREDVLFVDARGRAQFLEGHVPGALHIPYDPFSPSAAQGVQALPRERWLVIYCSSLTCDKASEMAETLRMEGFEDVLVMPGGWQAWLEAQGPVARQMDADQTEGGAQ